MQQNKLNTRKGSKEKSRATGTYFSGEGEGDGDVRGGGRCREGRVSYSDTERDGETDGQTEGQREGR